MQHTKTWQVLFLLLVMSFCRCRQEQNTPDLNTPQKNAVAPVTANVTTDVGVPLAAPDHIILVWFENKGYNQIIGHAQAPYINSLLSIGTLFTNAYALTHPSYPNYIRFFSGAYQGVTSNECISGTPFSSPNLYTVLAAAGSSFAWYSEDLPQRGSRTCRLGAYAEKHNPTTVFANVDTAANQPFSAFPTDTVGYAQLQKVVCITPNLLNDMHDGSISRGDQWLKDNLSNLVEWCRTHNSIFVVYWDEDNGKTDNRIPVIAVGQHVKANYQLSTHYDHYNWTKTICALMGASVDWTRRVSERSVISGCWQ